MTQPQKKAIECPDCRCHFLGRDEFVSHYRREHLGELDKARPRKPSGVQGAKGTYLRYRCRKCKAGFSNQDALDQHKAEDHLKWRLTKAQRTAPGARSLPTPGFGASAGWVRIVGGGLPGLGKRAK